ncbi:D-arabinono-1,4-lactone oxidase [Nannocystis radixulma]|uniref:D-arabinono-1,4-lactone oxidase n=1 Tax=Nannocystis radixulma TaxID=2995305 RepID=A0ABT5BCN3_9BACT|nr:D-arabinono-1,4-lactone oxidase [Nannocystis radixulma]MDC0671893.1 D-arabinono-1,4-lactone oxidase [Nannocystis radixulma]
MQLIPQYKWRNWNDNLACTADLYRPRGLHELREAVRLAGRKGRIRPLGNSCSWSPLVPTSGSLIDLGQLRGMHETSHDGAPAIRVEAGATVRDLVQFTQSRGLTLISPTIFQDISVGGAIAVAAHGTGLRTSTMSDEVVAMTLVDARGDVHHLSTADGELFDAARCSLGALGVVHDVTMRCWPEFHLHVEDRMIAIDDVLADLPDLARTYEFFELYWFPFTDRMWCKLMRRTDAPDPGASLSQRLKFAFTYACTFASCNGVLPLLGRVAPELTPAFMQLAPMLSMTPGSAVAPASRAFHYQRAYPRCWDMSYGVPLADAEQAWRRTIGLIERLARAARFPVNMVVHARFIGPSAALLAPAYGRAICDIEVVTTRTSRDADAFYDEWTAEMLAIEGARPHWGKYLLRPRDVRARYPKMDAFLAHRAALDPRGLFLNDWLEDAVFQLHP